MLPFRLMWALFVFCVGMLLETDPPADPPTSPPPPGPHAAPPEPRSGAKYTDEDVDKLKGDARKETRTSTTNAITDRFKQYGFESLDQVEELAKAYHATEEEQRTDLQKANTELDTLRPKVTSLEAENQRLQVESELKVALAAEGVAPKSIRKMLNDPDLPRPQLEEGRVPDTGISQFIEKAKEEWAPFFGAPQVQGGEKPPRIPASPTASGELRNDPVQSYFDSRYGEPDKDKST